MEAGKQANRQAGKQASKQGSESRLSRLQRARNNLDYAFLSAPYPSHFHFPISLHHGIQEYQVSVSPTAQRNYRMMNIAYVKDKYI